MTVTYTADVATCRKCGCFLTLLWRWRGSIYKLVWMDLVAFIGVYYLLAILYRFILNPEGQRGFESIVHYFESYHSLIPLSFVLGFFVQIVMQRWWEQYLSIPWPDPVAVFVSAHIHGQDDRARLMRRTIMRYMCLSQAIVFSMIAPRTKKRFPTMSHFVDAGLLQENEKVVFDSMDDAFPKIPKYWMPIVWAASIVTRARKEGRVRDDFAVKTIVDELNKFRGMLGGLLLYDFIPIPLVYTQVVTVAVYSFFLACVLGMQWTHMEEEGDPSKGLSKTLNFIFPVFTVLQFFFYMGWLKVAESLINPFGEDDDDFEVNWMIDRNLQVSYLIVDEMHQEHPDLVKDQYWDEVFPSELPYNTEVQREEHPEPSTTRLGERIQTMSVVQVDKHASFARPVDNLRDVQHPEGRQELFRRLSSVKSESEVRDMAESFYLTAKQSPTSREGATAPSSTETSYPVTQPSSPPLRTAETPHKVKIMDSVIPSIPETERYEPTPSGPSPAVQEMPAEFREKDDFDRLKEERDRERAERQKKRFMQHMEDATLMVTKPEAKVSEPWEIYGEEEEEEEVLEAEAEEEEQEQEQEQDDFKSFNSKAFD